jgi:hypothetical protein
MYSAYPDFIVYTSLRGVTLSFRQDLRARRIANALASRALWSCSRRTKRRVLRRVGRNFSDCLRAKNCSREDYSRIVIEVACA